MRKKRLWWLVPLGLLLVAEIALRVTGREVPPPSFCPNGAPRGDFRYEPREVLETAGGQVILCLGDGWTYGVGVTNREKWPHLVTDLLPNGRKKTTVATLSTSDWTTADADGVLPSALEKWSPAWIVVFVGVQDAMPLELLKEYPQGDPQTAETCPRPTLRTWHWWQRRRLAFRLWREDPDRPDNKEFLPRRDTVAGTQKALRSIVSLATDHDAQLVFVTYPKLPRAKFGPPWLPLESRYNFLIRAAATEAAAPVVDLEARWGDATAQYLLPWMMWPHPNAAGHADIAAGVAEAIRATSR
ncbi:MAG: SGNH/GDSL hydrolase family protein [Candidatus Lernaella stagnicola]|nr:SGNH/GDSL hydrolase family protein [Candidatus Lernaella stagnicola]